MAKKPKFQQEKNPLRMVIYIVVVLFLLLCLAGLYLNFRARHASFEEQVQQASQNETEYVMQRRESESESETETETETEQETETESETETDYSVSVLVLNGTQRPGVAGYWQDQLEEAGYTNVASASYNKTVDETTVIYGDDEAVAAPFLEFFQDAVFEEGTVEEGIEPEDGQELPEDVDIYIVIGRDDVPET